MCVAFEGAGDRMPPRPRTLDLDDAGRFTIPWHGKLTGDEALLAHPFCAWLGRIRRCLPAKALHPPAR